MFNDRYSYLLCRLAVGASMFGHGLVRLPKLNGFSHWMLGQFQHAILPAALVQPFSYILPFVELATGLLLLLGLFTRMALVTGSIVMIVLVFGSTAIEAWDAIPSQLIHVAFFAMLLSYIDKNNWAVDRLCTKGRAVA